MFEVWVESEKLLGNLNIISALSAFYHIVFCFNLKYPEVKRLKCKCLL